jgi:hypothetical protein
VEQVSLAQTLFATCLMLSQGYAGSFENLKELPDAKRHAFYGGTSVIAHWLKSYSTAMKWIRAFT